MEQKTLRSGYTTGTCAAAAAKAAAVFRLTGICPAMAEVGLPSGKRVCLETEEWEEHSVRVKKDAGDDPDVTHGAWIYAGVSEISRNRLDELKTSGSGYWLEAYPQLYLSGGAGIGRVTKPGLSCPVGHYAINPVPRQMILAAVDEAARRAAFDGCLMVEIRIPDGERLAEKTFNPKLGIEGGISVLGTTGIVKPMSEEALVATIRLDIHMKVVAGQKILLMAPGNYGEAFLKDEMEVSLGEAVLCSNFVRDAAGMLAEEGVQEVLFVSHIGKLIKVSAGAGNTHSRYGDGRMEQMERLVTAVWQKTKQHCSDEPEKLQEKVRACNTTDEAVGILLEYGLAKEVLVMMAEEAKQRMEAWAGQKVKVQVVAFSSAHGVTGKTSGADGLFVRWKERI